MSVLMLILFCTTSLAQDCKLSVDFEENSWAGTAYALRTVTDQWGEWSVSGVVSATDTNDRHNSGVKSIRLRGNAGDNCYFQMNFDKSNGVGEVSFYYASYSTHSGGIIVVYYSTDAGATWTNGGSVTAPKWDGAMIKATFPINIQGNVRIKIAREGELANGKTVSIDDFCLTDHSPAGYVISPTFNPPSGNYTEPINVVISSATESATIRYTTDGSDPTESSTQYTASIAVSTQTTLKAKAWKEGMQPSSISTANYLFPQTVTTLAELRTKAPAYNTEGKDVFVFSGQAVVTQRKVSTAANTAVTMYIQDGTAAIMIYDVAKKMQAVEIGDKITNITGTLTSYRGMLEIVPLGNCDVTGYLQQVPTTVITAPQLDNNYENSIQAKVVTIKGVTYTETGVFTKDKYYGLSENGMSYDSLVYVENLFDTDYIGNTIPTQIVEINGVCLYRLGKNRIVPLDKSNNIILSINNFNKSAIKLAPNPANSFVNVVIGAPMKLEIYTLIGNLIATENLYEGTNTIGLSNYPAGLYMMKLTDNNTGETSVQKLVIK